MTPEQRSAEASRYARPWSAIPDVVKERRYLTATARRFNITVEEAQRLMAVTHCESCGDELTKGTGQHAIDHNHEFGHVRGVLCAPCNKGLGHFRDDPVRMAKALAYLLSHGEDFVR